MARRPRGTGFLYRQKDSQGWWMQFTLDGVRHRESTGTNDKTQVEQALRERL